MLTPFELFCAGTNDEEFTPEDTTPAKGTRSKTKTPPKQKTSKKMSNKAAPQEEPAIVLDSGADADVWPDTGPAENVFMSRPFKRMVAKGAEVNEHTYYNIASFNFSNKDNDKVTAKTMLDHQGKRNIVRVSKPKYSSFFYGNKLTTFAEMILGDDPPSAIAFTQGILQTIKQSPMTTVDLHFPNEIQVSVHRVCSTHCVICRSAMKCTMCGRKDIMEIPNVTVFEVEEVSYTETAEATTRGVQREAEMSE